jgi:hypothetical protein
LLCAARIVGPVGICPAGTALRVQPEYPISTSCGSFRQVLASIQALIAGVPHGVQSFTATGTFTVPAGVTAVEVELWGGGSGSWASTASVSAGGGSGGGYARKRVSGLVPGAAIAVSIGAGGAAGTTAGLAPTAGGASSFGAYCSASGGAINPVNTPSAPSNGNLGGVGSGGDLNLYGGDGGQAIGSQGGAGGDGPLSGGVVNSGTTGRAGYAPGGGEFDRGNGV